MRTRCTRIPLAMLLLVLAARGGEVHASCTEIGTIATCGGNLGAGVAYSQSIWSLFVSGLSADITPQTFGASGASVDWQASAGGKDQPGAPSPNLLLVFDGGSFRIASPNGGGLAVSAQGGAGGDGTESRPLFGHDKVGNPGGAGGSAGGVTINLLSGDLTAGGPESSAVSVLTQGGTGGAGGELFPVGGQSHGGVGGAGGNGAAVAITAANSTIAQTTGGFGAVFVQGTGGAGGQGGESRTPSGDTYGGTGGAGGTGGTAAVSVGNLNIGMTGGTGAAVLVYAAGGAGGAGGQSFSAEHGYGGAGGAGGDGGAISIASDQPAQPGPLAITTTRATQHGIQGVSIAGPGGGGGLGEGDHATGGNGGQGGAGGTVTVNLAAATLVTGGDQAEGIFARSYGAPGGDGGAAKGFVSSTGGAGGAGGPGGSVAVTFAGTISTGISGGQATHATDSNGIFAHSVGGFSGDGGSAAGFVAYGASDQSAGDGGDVTVAVQGASSAILTTGGFSSGITAQSVGGGGGKASAGSGVVALGGTGSAGGSGGTVGLTNAAAVTTGGESSRGISAGSHGGGGGDGGGAGGIVAIGGASGTCGDGGQVTVGNAAGATLQTSGDRADALYAASIGGGGGTAHSTAGLAAIGGKGGNGGGGGPVGVVNDASIRTEGTQADGVFVQSVGGGGGDGSNAIAVSAFFSLAIGGSGGSGGGAQSASYSDSGTAGYRIDTQGNLARGIVVQSIGGGGGDGGNAISASGSPAFDVAIGASGSGNAGGNAGNATASTTAEVVSTHGVGAPAIVVHSAGGGGGHAGTTVAAGEGATLNLSVAVGGSGGSGGSSGQASATATGHISTVGDLSAGIFVHSVGGGGGDAGTSVAGTAVSSMEYTANVGGSGGNGGTGGAVAASSTGAIATGGNSSHGIHALSVGGGGGSAHFVGSFTAAAGVALQTSVGGHGGAGGSGSTVGVTAAGTIATAGANAPAIAAASVGGGGGDGGTTITADGITGGAIGVSVGGRGGASGDGAAVSVESSADITTAGDLSEGIRAHSIARGGGNSGTVATGTGVSLGNIGVSVGAAGGGGGASGAVTVNSEGDVTTQGMFSTAIDAKSVAGGGGNAKGSITTSGVSMGSLTATVGGSGGSGGNASTVQVGSNGALATAGDLAHGIVAASLGGGGGEGGYAIESGLSAGEVSGNLNINVGGAGGGGGSAAKVTVNTQGSIKTGGFGAFGIVAQSIGGNGGIGGAIYSGNLAFSSSGSAQITANFGGNGGDAALAGNVEIGNAANIATAGFFATGILAESIGGGGGAGGSVYTVAGTLTPASGVTFAGSVGGSGGSGNHAGTVTVANSGSITTAAGGAAGIGAASIGGGGGRGGNAAAINVNLAGGGAASSLTANLNVGVGGSGGAGGNADAVSVRNAGAITTAGASAFGIDAHSVGGGGGNGGTASSFTFGLAGLCRLATLATGGSGYLCKSSADAPERTTVKISLAVEVGGSGGAAGEGGTVSVDNTASITTTGDLAHGIYAKSVGGGGGHGGEGSMGISAWTTNQLAENIESLGKTFAQLPSFTAISVAVGGAGGASGNGGDVEVTNSATLHTSGGHAYGIHAQSVGGGGGDGGVANEGLWGKLAVGGRGSGGGTGGAVTVSSPGAIVTGGDGAIAIFAQSVGGGGGSAGNVEKGLAHSWENLNIGIGVGYQQDAGEGGDGGAVSVASGAITTTGARAHGIIAQSVGGSGGIAAISGDAVDVGVTTFAGSTGDPGKGGAVSVTVGGAITVSGEQSHGVFAQSVSGKKTEGDVSSDVTIDVNADIRATGTGGRAILAQSEGLVTSGNVVITVAEGVTVATGAQGDETIGIKDGASNLITNYGTLTQGNAESYVIRAGGSTTAKTSVVNHGTITGRILGTDVALLDGPALPGAVATPSRIDLDNRAGGVVDAGSLLDVASMTNAGTLVVGGSGRVGATRLTGDLLQGGGGLLVVDLNPGETGAAAADRLAIDGHADLDGRVVVNLLALWQVIQGVGSVPIVTAGAGLSATGLEVTRSAVAQYRLDSSKPGSLELSYDIDFANPGIVAHTNDNQDELARHLHAAYRGQGMDHATLRNLIAIEDPAAYAKAINTFSAEVAVDNQMVGLLSSSAFNESLAGCAERSGDYRYLGQGRCGWLALRATRFERRQSSDNLGFDDRSWQIAGGGQVDVGDGWYVGGALAYSQHNVSVGGVDAASDADQYQGGILALRRLGAAELSGALAFAYGAFDNRRALFDGSTASATQRQRVVSGQVRAAYLLPVGSWAVKPRVDLGIQHLSMDGFEDSGASGFRLSVDGRSDTYGYVVPAVDVLTEFETAAGMLARPRLTLGLTQLIGGATASATARFVAAPAAVGSFTTRTALDRTRVNAAAAVDLFVRKDLSLRAEVFGSFANDSDAYGGGVKAALSF